MGNRPLVKRMGLLLTRCLLAGATIVTASICPSRGWALHILLPQACTLESGPGDDVPWTSAQGSSMGHHHYVVHSASPAAVFLPGVLEEVISISFWPKKDTELSIAHKLPWPWNSTMHSKISSLFTWVLWSQGWKKWKNFNEKDVLRQGPIFCLFTDDFQSVLVLLVYPKQSG